MSMNEKVDIQIGRRRFSVEMEGLTPMEISALAAEVNKKMDEIAGQNDKVIDTALLAILTALHFADDMLKLEDKQRTQEMALERKVESMTLGLKTALAVVGKG